MDYLQEAKDELRRTEGISEDYPTMLTQAIAYAGVNAAIAQAEAMQLLVKRLEQFMETQGMGFEVIEAADRAIRYQAENEELRRRLGELGASSAPF